MISLSHKNRPTTLWSMLLKTRHSFAAVTTSRSKSMNWTCMSDSLPRGMAVIAICTILNIASMASAQISPNRATLSTPSRPLLHEIVSGPVPETLLRSTSGSRLAVTTAEGAGVTSPRNTAQSERWRRAPREGIPASAVRTSVENVQASDAVDLLLSAPVLGHQRPSNFPTGSHPLGSQSKGSRSTTISQEFRVSGADPLDGSMDRTATSAPAQHLNACQSVDPHQMEIWEQEYTTHVDDVLMNGTCPSEGGTIGDWWQQRLPYVEIVPVEPGQIKASVSNFINDHTLPPEHQYDVDIFDQNPISVASPQIVEPARPIATDDTKDAETLGKDRLKTDIRKIRPTLSYAMRNIEPNQLPDGFDKKLDQGDYIARQSSPAVLQWAPTNLYNYPLYFEDPSLERYGHTYHPAVQPFASAGRFATQLVGMPYQMALHPVRSREYTLGYYRPGECAPKKHYQIPFNEEAAFMQAAAMVGFFLIFP